MASSGFDPDRFRRLKEQQIATRDPLKKQRKLERSIAEKHRRAQTPFSITRLWNEIPNRWRGLFFGGLLGVVVVVVLPTILVSRWTMPCAATAFVFLLVLGFFVGRGIDARDDLRDLMR
jgi:hypothetical protein